MSLEYLTTLFADSAMRTGVVAALALALAGLIVYRAIRGGRPDDWLATFAAALTFGWTASAVWDIATDRLGWPREVAVALVTVFEVMLIVSYLRARRRWKTHKNAGRYGVTLWIIAWTMAIVAAFSVDSLSEALIRFAIPLTAARLMWDGLVGDDDPVRAEGALVWRWPLRRVLLELGLVEPSARDVWTDDRDRRTRRIANLEFRRRHGWRFLASRRRRALARRALVSDDAILSAAIADVRRAERFAGLMSIEEQIASPAAPETGTPSASDPILTVAMPSGTLVDIDRATEQIVGIGRTVPDPVEPAPAPAPVEQEPGTVVFFPRPPEPKRKAVHAQEPSPERTGVIDGRRVPVPDGATVVDGRIVSGEELNLIARQRYWKSVRDGSPYSQRGLGRSFDPPMSQPWGRDRIAEATAESPIVSPNGAAPDPAPAP